jgi:hypothetical protein
MDQPLRSATIRRILAIAACSVLLGCGVLIAGVDRTAAFPICRGSGIAKVCVNVDPNINNPSFIHFRLVSKDMNVVYNIRDGNRQWEEKGKAQNGLHYVARVPNATVSVQGCKPGVFGSNCGPWYAVPLIVTSGRPDPASCRSGFVWRSVTPKDLVCVTPAVRAQVQADNNLAASRRIHEPKPIGVCRVGRGCRLAMNVPCKPGFVWRTAVAEDFVCVTPAARAQALQDNTDAASRR